MRLRGLRTDIGPLEVKHNKYLGQLDPVSRACCLLLHNCNDLLDKLGKLLQEIYWSLISTDLATDPNHHLVL